MAITFPLTVALTSCTPLLGADDTSTSDTVVLANADVAATLCLRTGRVLRIADGAASSQAYATDSCDIYVVQGVDVPESEDAVSSVAKEEQSCAFVCTNPGLEGLTICKEYTLQGETLVKKVRLESDGGPVRLLQLDSQTEITGSVRARGSYYQAMDAGYEVSTYIFRPASEVASDYTLRHMDAGLMAFYDPVEDRTLAPYRVRQDGKVFGNY